VRSTIKEGGYKNGSSQEEAIGEYAEDKTGEESIFPVALDESKVEYGSQDTYKGC
jgi:hypothetical protein